MQEELQRFRVQQGGMAAWHDVFWNPIKRVYNRQKQPVPVTPAPSPQEPSPVPVQPPSQEPHDPNKEANVCILHPPDMQERKKFYEDVSSIRRNMKRLADAIAKMVDAAQEEAGGEDSENNPEGEEEQQLSRDERVYYIIH